MIKRTKEYCRDRLNAMFWSSNGGSGGGIDYSNSDLRQYWMPDAVSVECYDCNAKFNTFRRKHHCRVCGQIFCSSCCNIYIDGKCLGFSGKLRVCKFCFDFFDRFLKGIEPGAPLELLARAVPDRNPTLSLSLSTASLSSFDTTAATANTTNNTATYPLSTSVFYSSGPHPEQQDNTEILPFSLRDPNKLDQLWAEIVDLQTGIPSSKFTGRDLVSWLTRRDNSTTEEQAVAIGQALLDSKYMETYDETDENSGSSDDKCVFGNSSRQFRPLKSVAHEFPSQEREFETDGPDWLRNLRVPDCSQSASSSSISALNNEDALEVDGKVSSQMSSSVLDNITLQSKSSETGTNRLLLDRIYESHLTASLRALMAEEKLNPRWTNLILNFTRAIVCNVKLDPNVNDSLDIRQCIRVKKVPNGSIEDCRIISGEMFRNRNRKGKIIHDARILLVRGSIAYHRTKFTTFDNVLIQEEEYLKNICSRIKSFRPDLIIVENDVSFKAKEILELGNIVVLQNVKISVLERISKYFHTPILTSLESIPNLPELGRCGRYFEESFVITEKLVSSNYIILESESRKEAGCTVLLRGGSRKELAKVKRLIKQIALIRTNAKYEKAFLENEFVKIEDDDEDRVVSIPSMSLSPFVRFTNDVRESLENFEFEEDFGERDEENEGRDGVVETEPSLITTVIKADTNLDDLLAEFRAGTSDRPLSLPKVPIPKLYSNKVPLPVPSYYAKPKPLPVLFSSYSSLSRAFPYYCIVPWTVNMHFYGENDLPLGIFLETFCFSDGYACPNKICHTPMKDHIRRFCFNNGNVSMFLQQLSNPIDENDEIVTWKFCLECEKLGPVVKLSESSWNYSFAMFLLLLVYEGRLSGGNCRHSLHHQHYTCFSRGSLVASFKYSSLDPFSMALPCPREMTAVADRTVVTEDMTSLAVKGSSLFGEIHERLSRDEVVDEHWKRIYQEQVDEYRSRVNTIQNLLNSSDNSTVRQSMFRLRQYLYRCASDWKRRHNSSSSLSSSLDLGEDSNDDDDDNDLLPSHVHYSLPNSFIIVDETQPSSIVSYILATSDYRDFLREFSSSSSESSSSASLSPSSSSAPSSHFEYEFVDGDSAKFYSNAYFAREFDHLRRCVLKNPDEFVISLAECSPWQTSGGKSGLRFFKTRDDRFVLKQMSLIEFQSFHEFAPQYFDYMKDSLSQNNPSALAKILGVYKIGFKNTQTKRSLNIDLLVIENIFYGRSIAEKYDLKGSMRNRLVNTKSLDNNGGTNGTTLVLMDENLLKVACDRPLFIRDASKRILLNAIDRDTSFLAAASIMDYSLLVGIDSDNNELVVGIIDYIRSFTWDKKLENLIKKSGILGGSGHSPTIIPPKIYKRRFLDAMLKYFIVVPEYGME